MMRKLLLLLLSTVLIINTYAQDLNWAFDVGSEASTNDDEEGLGIARDAAGNIYVIGKFEGTADFNPDGGTTNNLTSNGDDDIYIAKYNSSGDYQWAFNIGGTGGDIGNGIVLDASSNIYVTGYFQNTADFNPDGGTTNNLTSNSSADMFVAKYNSDGDYQWAFNIGASSFDRGNDIAIDASSNIYLTGYFQSTTDFNPDGGTTNNLTSNGSTDIFVAKYNSSGDYQWAFNIGSSTTDRGWGIAVDASSNVYVTGQFRDSNVDFNPDGGTTNNLSSNGSGDGYLAKYNSNGDYQWAFNIGGTGNDQGYGIALDASSNVYLTGYFSGSNVDFDPSGSTNDLTSNGGNDIFVAKYNTSGDYQWAFNLGGTGSDIGYHLNVDGTSVYVTGFFSGSNVDFNPDAGTTNDLTSNGGDDIFVAKYSSIGEYGGAFNMGGTSNDYGRRVVADNTGQTYVTGHFSGTSVDFDPDPGSATNLGTSADKDDNFFVASYKASALPTMFVQTQDRNNALNFDGTDDYVTCGDIDAIDGATTLTIETWIYPESFVLYATPISKTADVSNCVGIQYRNTSGNIAMFARDGNSIPRATTTSNVLTLNTWTHVAFVYDGTQATNTDRIKCYINGSEVALSFLGTIPTQLDDNSADFLLGSFMPASSHFDGSLDEVRIWSTARSEAEIQSLMNSELCGSETGLIAYYNFYQGTAGGDNSAITTLEDKTANNNDGTLTNFTKTGASSNFVTSTVIENNALNFDGTDDYVDFGDVDAIDGASTLTMEAWIYVESYGSFPTIIAKTESNSNTVGITLDNGTGVLTALTRNGASGAGQDGLGKTTTTVSLNTWTHVAMVFDGTQSGNSERLKFYINGVEEALTYSNTIPATLPNTSDNLTIGRYSSGGFYFDGSIEEVRIWSTARSGTDIATYYQNEVIGSNSDLIAYYKLNQGEADGTNTNVTTVKDASNNCNDGTITNMALTGTSSNWVAGHAGVPLPVEMTYFRGQAITSGSYLEWQTATEENNDGFEIQRSIDGKNWEKIGFEAGAGTTFEVQNYDFLDARPLTGTNYYRLKQIDFDGKFDYSQVVTIFYGQELANDNFKVFPNPVKDQLTIMDGEGIATIYNILGQPVKEFTINNAQFSIDMNDLPKGQYILRISRQNGNVVTKQLIK